MLTFIYHSSTLQSARDFIEFSILGKAFKCHNISWLADSGHRCSLSAPLRHPLLLFSRQFHSIVFLFGGVFFIGFRMNSIKPFRFRIHLAFSFRFCCCQMIECDLKSTNAGKYKKNNKTAIQNNQLRIACMSIK